MKKVFIAIVTITCGLLIALIILSVFGSLRPYTLFGADDRKDAFAKLLVSYGYEIVDVKSVYTTNIIILKTASVFLTTLSSLNITKIYRTYYAFYFISPFDTFVYQYNP